MQFSCLTLNNFMSYSFERFHFQDEGLVLISGTNLDEGDSNGSGKSSIWDGISWVLFGQTVRGLKNDDVINRKFGKDCIVRLEFWVNKTLFYVERYRKHGEYGNRLKITYAECGEVIEKGTLALTEQYLHDLIGIDYDLFRCTVLFAQGETFNFVNSGNKKQKEILSKIMKLELKKHLETAKLKKKLVEEEKNENERKIDILESHKKDNPKEELEKESKDYEKERSLKIENLKLHKDSLQFDLKNTEVKDVSKLKLISTKLRDDIKNKESIIAEKYLNRMLKIDSKRSFIIDEIDRLDAFLKRGECPTCGQTVKELGTKRHELANQAQKMNYLKDELEERSREQRFLLQEQESRFDKLNEIIEAENINQRQLERLENEIKKCSEDIEQLKLQENPFDEMIEKEVKRQEEIKAKLVVIGQEIERNEKEIEYLEFWVNAFGDAGIKSFVFDLIAGNLTEKSNKYVNILTNGQVSIKFDTQTQLKSGAVREKFDCSVVTEGKKIKYDAYSGGEKRRISLAVDMALSEIMAEYHGERFNVVVFDEQDNYLDRQGREYYLELLKQLAKERNVFVVSHDSEFKSKFDKTWNIVKEEGVSCLQ